MRRALAFTVAAACLQVSAVGFAKPSNPQALEHLQHGAELYQQEKYDEAIAAYEKGFELENDSAFLYALAQAERQRGNCSAAVKFYRRYLKADPSEAGAALAKEGMVRCAEQLAEKEGAPPPAVEPEPAEGTAPAPEQVAPPEIEPSLEDDASSKKAAKKWHRDPVGASLVAVGLGGMAAGAGLLIAAQVELRAARNSEDYGEFDLHKGRYDRYFPTGAIVAGVGGALLVGGAIRWAILGARARKQTALTPVLGPRTAGIQISGRF